MVYDAKSIQVLKGMEAVRRRPSMYIGDTSIRGLHHLVFEVVDNSIDEAMVGRCDRIKVTMNSDESITVTDNGSGIPVDIHPQQKKPAVEVVLTMLHAGGKFDRKTYQVSGGLHGVGVSVVNALSERLAVEVKRNGNIYGQQYERGEVKSPLKIIGTAKKTGTKIRFMPDREIFEEVEFNFDLLANRLRELAFLNKGLTISLSEEKSGKSVEFQYKGGIVEFVKFLDVNKTALHKPIYFSGKSNGVVVEMAMQYTDAFMENIFTFANNIDTKEGGTHLIGLKSAFTRSFNEYGKKNNIIKNEIPSGDDVREGITCVLSVNLPNPQFEGQTKTKLGNSDVKGIVESFIGEKLSSYLEEHPSIANKILAKILIATRSRVAAKKARELTRRKGLLESDSLPGKLADCSITDAALAEIFIVEGDSAGGSAKQGRDRSYQAILPLRGKLLNVEKARLDKILSNDGIRTIVSALGTGIGGDDFDADKARYHHIIIMTDADVDGSHIRTLLLTFFYRYARELIERGYIYIAQPPLYRVKKNREAKYAFDEKELQQILKTMGKSENVHIQRYKGLGEMNPDQLWETTMDPETRTLKRITLEDVMAAEEIFTILMGNAVAPRRSFIEENARIVQNLDV
ncbi:MAG: DNA topoisomerase (ATP-hydrolyzing) subunit B [Candidatus Cloacimonadota bacterium]|nr:MAG: DNA topoisomerase (ATP-hydrolyzing) subunit B [Candidatus Cloacimonadota bacterium]